MEDQYGAQDVIEQELSESGHSPLFPIFKKRVNDAICKIIKEKVTPWSFLRSGLRVSRADGSLITCSGLDFAGSIKTLFWSRYIEPFLEDLSIAVIQEAVSMAEKKGLDARPLLLEVHGLLVAGYHKVFTKMADVDRRLRGRGYPETVPLRSIDREFAAMRRFLNEVTQGEISIIAEREEKAPSLKVPLNETLWRRFSESWEFKPGFWGISIDLKRLFKKKG